jgi:predicted ATPase
VDNNAANCRANDYKGIAMTARAKRTNRILKVSIEGFRSLRNVENLELPQLTILIGGNGAGKSTFIRFFEMMSWMMKSQNLQEFILRQGGGDDQFFMGARHTSRISATIELETAAGVNEYTFDLTHLMVNDTVLILNEAYRYSDKRGTPANWSKIGEVGKESLLPLQKNKTAQTICLLLRQCQTFQFHDTSINAAIHKRWDVSDSIRLRTDGGNLAAVLLSLKTHEPARYALILQQISRVLPSFKDFVLEPEYGKVLLRWQSQGNDKIFGAHLTSDGSLRLFCLLTLLYMPVQR